MNSVYMGYLLHPYVLNLYVSYLKWVSCRQHRVGSYFFIHYDNLCLLIRVFPINNYQYGWGLVFHLACPSGCFLFPLFIFFGIN